MNVLGICDVEGECCNFIFESEEGLMFFVII